MRGLGVTGFPENIPTHVYIWFIHFFELSKLLQDMIQSETSNPGTSKKWIKFVKCHWERDERQPIHEDSSKDCSSCRRYVDEHDDLAIWWFKVGNDKFIRMTFKHFCNDDTIFECCIMWIKMFGMLEVELKVEAAAEGENIRRSFRVVCNVQC